MTAEIGELSDQLRGVISWPGAEVEEPNGAPRVRRCASKDYDASHFTVKHAWRVLDAPDAAIDGLKERAEEDLAGLGWVIDGIGRVNSRARQFEITARTEYGTKDGVAAGGAWLHISVYDHRDPGRTEEISSYVVVRIQSYCHPRAAADDGRAAAADSFAPESLDARFGDPRGPR